jgi:hypothetical protein
MDWIIKKNEKMYEEVPRGGSEPTQRHLSKTPSSLGKQDEDKPEKTRNEGKIRKPQRLK